MDDETPPSTFDALAAACSGHVDEHIASLLRPAEPVENLHDAALYSLGLDQQDEAARGKRVRPVLCLVTAQTLGADIHRAMPFAAAIELMHNFALVHDDIEDGDEMRRNRPSVHVRYGLPHGINIGDFLLSKVWSALLDGAVDWSDELRLGLLRLMADTLEHTITGQALDMNARQSRDFRARDYFRLVREKTGFYLAAPMLGGAMVAEAEPGVMEAIRGFGHAMGPLFQIVDDLLDLTAGKGRGGLIGSDVREGKRSYLVAAATEQAADAERIRLYDILDLPREDTTDEHVAEVVAIFERTGALETAQNRTQLLLEQGLDALEPAPPELTVILADFARRMASRQT